VSKPSKAGLLTLLLFPGYGFYMALEKEFDDLRTDVKAALAKMKAALIKWMFIFWIGQIVAIFGLIKFLFPTL
jgi:hypothetical protein